MRSSLLQAVGQMEIRTDLVDAHLYAFNRLLVQGVLESRPGQKSIKHDLVPYLVRSQLRLGVSSTIVGSPLEDRAENVNHLLDAEAFGKNRLQVAHSGLKCSTYIASKDRYCSRVNSLQVKFCQDDNHWLPTWQVCPVICAVVTVLNQLCKKNSECKVMG